MVENIGSSIMHRVSLMKVGRKSSDHNWHALEEDYCGHSWQFQNDNSISETKEVDDPASLRDSYCGICRIRRRANGVEP